MTNFEAGRVRPLFREGSWDGMTTGVGMLDGAPVYLDAREDLGGSELKPEWDRVRTLLEQEFSEEDFQEMWEEIEDRLDDVMHQSLPRKFTVFRLSEDEFATLVERHKAFQSHVGMHCDFEYDEEGCPRRKGGYWGLSCAYIKAHFYDPYPPAQEFNLEALPVLGYVEAPNLYAGGPERPPQAEDPRSAELKRYQQTWRDGDPVRLDW